MPSPSNPDVKILNIKGGYYAAIIYSGRTSDKNFIKHKSILENELKPEMLLVTHAHFDHLTGVGFVQDEFDIPFCTVDYKASNSSNIITFL